MYTYRVVKEEYPTGKRSSRTRVITRNGPLEVGGLYMHLGYGFRGCYRVLEELEGESYEDD